MSDVTRQRRRPALALLVALAALFAPTWLAARAPRAPAAPPVDPALYAGLRWRMLGPFRGGRVNAVTGVPGRPDTFYFGSVGGGVWKTTNAGRTWLPVFDSQPIASIGAIAVAPSNVSVVYVGTGEADMRSQISHGNGVYKSTDAGRTWNHLGLDDTRQIGRILVDPRSPDIVFVAALGHAYGPNAARGVYRSRDGGSTWQQVLFKGENVGAIDLAMDPRDSKVIYATLWNTRRPPWSIYPPSYGPGGGVFKSTDGGTTWKPLTIGLPTEGLGRIGLAVSPVNPKRVYAIVDARQGGLYRSDDAGVSWTLVSGDQRIWGRGWYFGKVSADPKDPEVVYVSNTSLYRSSDGGRAWTAIKGAPGGDDYHQLWIAPDDSNRMVLGSDQGAIVTVDGARTWSSWYNQPTAQVYHVAGDYRYPYWVTGSQQDSGPVSVATQSMFAELGTRTWLPACAGGESGYTAPDPLHPDLLFGGTVARCDVRTGETTNVSPERMMKEPPRHTWTLPLVFSKADPRTLYFSNQFLFKTTDGGNSWTQISGDLTREDPGVPPNLDAATAADAPPAKRRGVIYTIAPSPLTTATIWAGTDDGLVHVTWDEGKTWQEVTPPALTPWSKVVMMEASYADINTAYAAVDRHRLEDYEPYLYRTRDGGRSWQRITAGLPAGVYVQTVKEDPRRPGLLFAGTELGVFVSFDAGDRWQSLQLNLPAVSVRDLEVHGDDLIVATHGRGFWMIDAVTALRQATDEVARGEAFLFRPADAVLTPPPNENGTPQPRDEPLAENRPYGALIDFYISRASGPVTLEVLNPAGVVLRRYSSDTSVQPVDPNSLSIPAFWRPAPEAFPATPGQHRWVWDLRTEAKPAPRSAGAAASTGGEEGPSRRGPLVVPGTYTVKLTVGGRNWTQPLHVVRDPR
ncbi:MAG TPA: hypothetical protein VGK32_21690 [Vicinamibacterales bacterium]|jgi:photosystem II stability/assembly factor-like uncharacterized protein